MASFFPCDPNFKVQGFLVVSGLLPEFFSTGFVSVHEVVLGFEEKAYPFCCHRCILFVPLILFLKFLFHVMRLYGQRKLEKLCGSSVGVFVPVPQ